MVWKRVFRTFSLFVLSFALYSAPTAGQDQPDGQEDQPQAVLAPVPGGPGFLMVPAPAFIPFNNNILYEVGSGIFLKTLPGSPHYQYVAPVMLPHTMR